jgi:L-serine dehydratase
MSLERGDRSAVMIGSSLGAGRVRVSEIDGFPVEVSGNYHTVVLVAEDIPGSIARIATLLAEDGLNIANLRLTRQKRGGDAFMVIELDDYPAETVRDHIHVARVRWAFRLDEVSHSYVPLTAAVRDAEARNISLITTRARG